MENINHHYQHIRDSLVKASLAQYGKLICGICKKEIVDNGLKFSQCNWNIDHIIPLGVGGKDTVGNTQLAHRLCNSAKGCRGPEGVHT